MPLWKYTGTVPVRVGGSKVSPGEMCQFSGSPGDNFTEVPDPNPLVKKYVPKVAPKATSSQPSGSSVKSKKE